MDMTSYLKCTSALAISHLIICGKILVFRRASLHSGGAGGRARAASLPWELARVKAPCVLDLRVPLLGKQHEPPVAYGGGRDAVAARARWRQQARCWRRQARRSQR